ncbi:hypothetical protein O181_039788 [Austropuccinia psidii MF-1]|uniref:Uncharacterized protein n=1 Tax=Austropuccinia psidii MF-1 TaxID=1389203 RepID=A0A9Q3DE26_9BASI|nr:hypothetical protein [Austropuccinia psidii MF-1]
MNQEFQAAVSAATIKQNEQISKLQKAISSRNDMFRKLLLKFETLQVEPHTPASTSSSRKTPKKVKENAKSTTLTRSFQTPTKPPKSSLKSKGHHNMRTPNIHNPKANKTKPMSKRSLLKTKEAFFNHKKILWGLTDDKEIPKTPYPALLQELYHQFSHNAELETVASNTSASSLINPQEIITLKGVHIGSPTNGTPHPDERLQYSAFTNKYWETLTTEYDISHKIEDSDSSSDEEDQSIDLSFGNNESFDEEEMQIEQESTDNSLFEGELDPYEDNDNAMQTRFLA